MSLFYLPGIASVSPIVMSALHSINIRDLSRGTWNR